MQAIRLIFLPISTVLCGFAFRTVVPATDSTIVADARGPRKAPPAVPMSWMRSLDRQIVVGFGKVHEELDLNPCPNCTPNWPPDNSQGFPVHPTHSQGFPQAGQPESRIDIRFTHLEQLDGQCVKQGTTCVNNKCRGKINLYIKNNIQGITITWSYSPGGTPGTIPPSQHSNKVLEEQKDCGAWVNYIVTITWTENDVQRQAEYSFPLGCTACPSTE